MFRRLDDARAEITIFFEDRPVTAREGESVAAALLG